MLPQILLPLLLLAALPTPALAEDLECGTGAGLILCNLFSCAKSTSLCPQIDSFTCPTSYIACPTPGVCVTNSSDCPTNITCSGSAMLLCWNGICATSCPTYVECPDYAPYRCPNGECRASLLDCPQPKTCPGIAPYKCMDGSCRVSSSDCAGVEALYSYSKGYAKCPDGRNMPSLSMCGTERTCPVGYIKCWSGACASNLTLCDKLCPESTPYYNNDGTCTVSYSAVAAKCTDSSAAYYCDGQCVANYKDCYKGIICNSSSVMCGDGSCRTSFDACPTETLCPMERPVKCYDGTCTTSVSNCPAIADCSSASYKRCPNGLCVSLTAECGTGVTCMSSTPVKCYDNTCRKDISECPERPMCPSNKTFLCSDGSCQKSLEQCSSESQCTGYQIKCPDLTCVTKLEYCRELSGCPPGMYPCPDKSCRPSSQLCPTDACPVSMPLMCMDGMCVQDSTECNSNSTGCPYKSPLKCSDGTCISKISSCTKGLVLNISDDYYLCPDGAVSDNIDTCYSVYGCPSDTPFMCYDGTCIDLSKQSCDVASCPITLPYRCSDGQCASSKNSCRNFGSADECTSSGGVPCADGRCMPKAEFCRPLRPCGYGYVRCADGSCRRDLTLCPLSTQMNCPTNRPYRCSNGACVDASSSCSTSSSSTGCSNIKCTYINGELKLYFGRCVGTAADCSITSSDTPIYNGCTYSKPIKCADGSCAATTTACTSQEGATCSSTKFKCDLNTCVTSQSACGSSSDCYKNYTKCLSSNTNCPLGSPFRCPDGSCASVSFLPFAPINNTSVTYCKPRVVCSPTAPYMCDDGSCQSSPERCNPLQPKTRCSNGEPAASSANCTSKVLRCPPLRPILCSSGACVGEIEECKKVEARCPASTPLRCANGMCVQYYGDCIPTDLKAPAAGSDTRCNSTLPFLCPDGSCALDSGECLAIVSGCNDPALPVKCKTGECKASTTTCAALEKSLPTCASKQRLCEDGICRTKCPDYNGCPLKKPVQCPNGYCGTTVSECAGISDCPLERPFNCYSGVCVKAFSECAIHPRAVKPYTVMITVDSQQEIDADIIVNSTGSILGKLYIPSNTLGYISSTATDTINLVVKQIPDSKLRKYPVPISETILPYVKQKCQVGYDRLDTILIIQSPAVNITASTINATKNVTKLNNYLTLQLYTVIPKGANVSNDFCLGKVDDVTLVWKCYSRDLKNITDGRFIYFTKEMGAYAVLFSPLYATSDSTWTGGVYVLWFAEHPRLAALYVLVLFLLVVFIALSLWCVSIQMKEYNRTARELNDYQNALRENLGPTETNARASEESEEAGNMLDGEPHKRFLQMKEEIQSLRAELAHFKTTSREEEKQ